MYPINSYGLSNTSFENEGEIGDAYPSMLQNFQEEAFCPMDPYRCGRALSSLDGCDWRNGISSLSQMLVSFSERLSCYFQSHVILEPFYRKEAAFHIFFGGPKPQGPGAIDVAVFLTVPGWENYPQELLDTVHRCFLEHMQHSHQQGLIQAELVVNAAIAQLLLHVGSYKLLFSLDLHVPYATTLEALMVSTTGTFAVALTQDMPSVLADAQEKKIRSTGQVAKVNSDELYRIWTFVTLGYSFEDPHFRTATLQEYEALSRGYLHTMSLWGSLAHQGTALEVLTGFNLYLYGLTEGAFSQGTLEALAAYLRLRADRVPGELENSIYARLWQVALSESSDGVVFRLQRCMSELFNENILDDRNLQVGSVVVSGKPWQPYYLVLPKKLKSPIHLSQGHVSRNIIVMKGTESQPQPEKKVSIPEPVAPVADRPKVPSQKKKVNAVNTQKVQPERVIITRGSPLPEFDVPKSSTHPSYKDALLKKNTPDPSWLGTSREKNNTNADVKEAVYSLPTPSYKQEIRTNQQESTKSRNPLTRAPIVDKKILGKYLEMPIGITPEMCWGDIPMDDDECYLDSQK